MTMKIVQAVDYGGRTRAAILVYVRYSQDPLFEREPTPSELRLIVEYCFDYIHAPELVFPRELIAHLREQVVHIKLPHELTNWLEGCRTIGIYPLGLERL